MLLAAITFIAFALRIQCCFWGNPLELHPDEGATVHYAIDMLSRHSWEAHTYDSPDHFEIKCDAVLFTIVSWLIYHKPAYEAFPEHRMVFFILARCYTALFGAALVPLAAIFTGALTEGLGSRYQRMAQMCAAILIAFSAIFVQHSAYATPDIVLTFFVLLFAYGMMRYLENGNKKYRYLCMVTIGIGITIKYPSAILCIPLAGMVIYRARHSQHWRNSAYNLYACSKLNYGYPHGLREFHRGSPSIPFGSRWARILWESDVLSQNNSL